VEANASLLDLSNPNEYSIDVLYAAYFDASGDSHSQAVLAVGGFVAQAEAWVSWEHDWKMRLNREGMVMLHMKELSGWNLLKKQRLITDLCEITQHHVARKFGVVVINRELKAGLSEAERRKWRIQAYSIAGRTAAREVKLWSDSWGGRLPELIFEDGDQGKGNLIHLLTTQGYPQPLFKPKKDCRHKKSGVLIKSAIPLQSADMLSYALFSYCRGWPSTLGQPRLNRFLENIPGEWGTIEEDRFRFIVDGLEQEDSLIATTTVKIKTR